MDTTHLQLNNGKRVPGIGFGTWHIAPAAAQGAVESAVMKAGYRHVDCASIYKNQKEVGQAFKTILKSGVPRGELFVTSKLWNTDHGRVEAACKQTLADLGLEYLDLYLIHWGIAFQAGDDREPLDKNGVVLTENVSLQQTWKAMEKLVEQGFVKSIGISNFTAPMIVDLLTYAKVKPVMNQIELHPYMAQTDLVNFCKYKGIELTAYSPLASGPQTFEAPVLKKLAERYGKTQAQIILRWAVDRGTVPIPRSTNTDRIAENIDIFDFKLTQAEQDEITALNKNQRVVDPFEWWQVPYFA